MIPPAIPPSCTSPGEKEIFARLKDEPGTQDWIRHFTLWTLLTTCGKSSVKPTL